MVMTEVIPRGLKSSLHRYINEVIPNFLSVADKISMDAYGRRFLDLFFSSPCKAYCLLKEYYKDMSVVDFLLLRLILKPLAIRLGDVMLSDEMLLYVKNCREKEFKTILEKALSDKKIGARALGLVQ